MLRRVGNSAVHDFVGSRQEALDALTIAYRLACWFHKSFGDAHARTAWKPLAYVPPPDPTAVQPPVPWAPPAPAPPPAA